MHFLPLFSRNCRHRGTALDGGDVAQPDHVARRVGIDDLLCHIVLRVHLGAQMYRAHRVLVVHGPADQRHPLRLQGR